MWVKAPALFSRQEIVEEHLLTWIKVQFEPNFDTTKPKVFPLVVG